MNNHLNFSHSVHSGMEQLIANKQQSMPAMVIYAQPPGTIQMQAPAPNIILSNVQPPPLQ